MKDEEIINVCKKYEKDLKELHFSNAIFHHVEWMLVQIPKFIKKKQKEKADRWLGFIQGVLYVKKIYTIEKLKKHNRNYENKTEKIN